MRVENLDGLRDTEHGPRVAEDARRMQVDDHARDVVQNRRLAPPCQRFPETVLFSAKIGGEKRIGKGQGSRQNLPCMLPNWLLIRSFTSISTTILPCLPSSDREMWIRSTLSLSKAHLLNPGLSSSPNDWSMSTIWARADSTDCTLILLDDMFLYSLSLFRCLCPSSTSSSTPLA